MYIQLIYAVIVAQTPPTPGVASDTVAIVSAITSALVSMSTMFFTYQKMKYDFSKKEQEYEEREKLCRKEISDMKTEMTTMRMKFESQVKNLTDDNSLLRKEREGDRIEMDRLRTREKGLTEQVENLTQVIEDMKVPKRRRSGNDPKTL